MLQKQWLASRRSRRLRLYGRILLESIVLRCPNSALFTTQDEQFIWLIASNKAENSAVSEICEQIVTSLMSILDIEVTIGALYFRFTSMFSIVGYCHNEEGGRGALSMSSYVKYRSGRSMRAALHMK
ncbi:hypothetical protein [Paenibacillus nasutitermitis]|uniref:hypothetical protein n=1 Tax=Paenibacillus nasutitermitis TaxID=1652958 RepID=UPI0016680682|nr:hypothetical protein [Paenibacillus nasutitermitis]